jgi:hypothetical protein
MNHQNQLEQMANGAMFATVIPTWTKGYGVCAGISGHVDERSLVPAPKLNRE